MKKFCFYLIIFLIMANGMLHSKSNNFSNTGIIYLSPVPNSTMNSPNTNIIIRTGNLLNKKTVNSGDLVVNGSKSGLHQGNVILSGGGSTMVFNPYNKFDEGETVSVLLKNGVEDISGNKIGKYGFSFLITKLNLNLKGNRNMHLQNEVSEMVQGNNTASNSLSLMKMQKVNIDGLNLPSDFPQLNISVSADPCPGYIFLSNFTWSTKIQVTPFLLILDNTGKPFYYKKMDERCFDFKLQSNGLITYFDHKAGYFYGMNSNFAIVDSFACGNGYETDMHELQILHNGNFLIRGDDYEKVDMSKIVPGGDKSATVEGVIIQELDKNKNVIFQWRSFDHYKITDATSDINLLNSTIDPVHTNAIELDNDGNLLISDRHMDEITKINMKTGDIIWRLGGKNNQFKFINDSVGFSHQHDIRRLPNGDITLFDDGNLHWLQLASRAVEYKLDEINKTAKLVWQFGNTPPEESAAMGNVQRLADGNTIIGWGTGRPAVTEVTPQGVKEFELSLPANEYNYRAFRFKLDTSYYKPFMPVLELPLNAAQTTDSLMTFNWRRNKFAQSFHFQLAGDSTFTGNILKDSVLTGTSLTVYNLKDGKKYYWHVLSNNNTDSEGGYSGYTRVKEFTTLLKQPANLNVSTKININELSWTNISQNADSLIIERKGGSDTVDYKKIAELSGAADKFSDKNPDRINVISDIYRYRIRAINKYSHSGYTYSSDITWLVSGVNVPIIYALQQNYPNPFNPTTTIEYSIPKISFVTLKVYDILGRIVADLVNTEKAPGNYKVNFDGSKLSSGIYFYKILAGSYTSVKKMILMK